MSYTCINCNYETNDPANFVRHKKTKKHKLALEKVNSNEINSTLVSSVSSGVSSVSIKTTILSSNKNNLICENCGKEFNHKSSLSRHKSKYCYNNSYNSLIKKEKEIMQKEFDLKLEISEREKEIYKKLEKEKSEMLNTFMNNANILLNKANDNTKITAQAMQTVSVSALKYANDKFKDTPALLPLDNFNINNLDFDNEEDKKQLIEILIYNAKQKSLDKLLGDHLIKYYKKDNPEDQTFHATDCSRLNYIVRELIENALIWSVDKNGIKICTSIIKPLIKKCISALMEYQKVLLHEMSLGNLNKQKEVELIIDIIMSIDSGTLEENINKYIAPYFNLDKTKNQL